MRKWNSNEFYTPTIAPTMDDDDSQNNGDIVSRSGASARLEGLGSMGTVELQYSFVPRAAR